jgi:hypothetical protein
VDFSEVRVRNFRTLKTLRTRTQLDLFFFEYFFDFLIMILFFEFFEKWLLSPSPSQSPNFGLQSESESDEMAGSEKLC